MARIERRNFNKMIKKILFLLLAVCLLAVMIPSGVFATDGNMWLVWDSGRCGPDVEWRIEDTASGSGVTGRLIISGTGAMYDYDSVNSDDYEKVFAPWHGYAHNIRDIIVNYGVTYIGNSAFELFTEAINIDIPSSVTGIGNNAFYECSNITDICYGGDEDAWNQISVAEGNKYLKYANMYYNAFEFGVKTSGICGDNLTWTFDEETGVLTISGTGEMYDSPEWFCDAAEYYDHGEIYHYNEGIRKIVMEEGITGIGEFAFLDLRGLSEVRIAGSVTNIDDGAFDNESITSIEVAPDNPKYSSYEGVMYNKDKTELVRYPEGRGGIATVPDGVIKIGDHAFSSCNDITGVTIPNSVESIGVRAFAGCWSLTSVNIPDSVLDIGEYAFVFCRSLVLADLPDSLTVIDAGLFADCYSLSGIIIPDDVLYIVDEAFSGCPLEKVTIPKSVEYIGESAFESFMDATLNDVYYSGSRDDWQKIYIGEHNDQFDNATFHYNWACNHNWTKGEVVSEATCTTAKQIKKTCTLCGDTEITSSGEALGHDYKATVTNPSCEEKGYTTHKCSRCEDSYVDAYTHATGHKWNEGVYDSANPGVLTYSCANCDETKEELYELSIIAKINELASKELTAEDKAAVDALRAEYEALPDGEKALVMNAGKIDEMAAMVQRAIVNELISSIDELAGKELTFEDKAAVDAIKAAYDALTESEKALVTNAGKIQEMVEKIAALAPKYKLGDVNGDGKINALDATQILRYANNKSSVLSSLDIAGARGKADVNGDGKINALDATQILRYANNKSSVLTK